MCIICMLMGGMPPEAKVVDGVIVNGQAQTTNFSSWLNTSSTSSQTKPQVLSSAVPEVTEAAMVFQFVTGRVPSAQGMDYLVSPTGANPENLNSAHYQGLSFENKYIDLAVTLAQPGSGHVDFQAAYGSNTLLDATRQAYTAIFGTAPSDEKLHAILDQTVVMNGQAVTRAEYFAAYAHADAGSQETKAAMIGWLLAEAEKAHVGPYAHAVDAMVADGVQFEVSLVGAPVASPDPALPA